MTSDLKDDMHRASTMATVAVLMLLVACGGATAGAPAGGDTSRAASEPASAVPSPPTPWADMSQEERRAWMGAEVMPRMSALFQAHDAERYTDVSCATCHGPSPRANGFRMPSPALPALHATGTPEQQQMVREYPEMVRFMFNRVMPAAQTLVGGAPYDAATGTGFSCFSCHPHAGDEGTTPVRLGSAPASAPTGA